MNLTWRVEKGAGERRNRAKGKEKGGGGAGEIGEREVGRDTEEAERKRPTETIRVAREEKSKRHIQ